MLESSSSEVELEDEHLSGIPALLMDVLIHIYIYIYRQFGSDTQQRQDGDGGL